MTQRAPSLLAWALALAVCAIACRRTVAVAVLESARGTTERSRDDLSRWSVAQPGATFAMGDAVRTGPRSSARVRFLAGGAVQLGPRTVVRFSSRPQSRRGNSVRVVSGEAEIEPGGDEIVFETANGTARVTRGTRVRIAAEAGIERFVVLVGRLEYERRGEATVTATAGERLVVSISTAVLEPVEPRTSAAVTPPSPPQSPTPVAPSTEQDAATVADNAANDGGGSTAPIEPTSPATPGATATAVHASNGAPTVDGENAPDAPQPDHVDLSLDAGDSFTIHDLASTTAARVRFGSHCSAGGRVEVAGPSGTLWYRGTDNVTIALGSGGWRYRLRCTGAAAHPGGEPSGRLRVTRDSGSAPMPRTPPRTPVDTDGRQYNVLYQNLLPEITVRWPRAPSAPGYTLRIRSPGGQTRTMRAPQPTVTVPSGRLADGLHHFRFETEGGATARSQETALQITFDNATRAAQIRTPVNGGSFGATAHVSGLALDGANVSANGVTLALDGQRRFQGDVPVPAGTPVVIRISHRQVGVHLYVIRSGAQAR